MLHDPWGEADEPRDPAQSAYAGLLSDAGAMARVVVPSVNIDLHVFHGTDSATLTRGAGHMYGTSLPVGGVDTHAVISAHTGMRAHTYFDRLVEVGLGDEFFIDVAGERLAYEVDDISLVLPHEIDAVAMVPGQDLVTLLTCYTPPENTHRLLVRGHRVTTVAEPDAGTPSEAQDAETAAPAAPAERAPASEAAVDYSVQGWMWPRLIGVAVAVGLWLLMLLGWRRGDRLAAHGAPRRSAQ